jgi:hypothetical protein
MFHERFVANVRFYHPYIVRKAQLIPKWILALLKNAYVDSSAGEGGYKRFRFKNQLLHPAYLSLKTPLVSARFQALEISEKYTLVHLSASTPLEGRSGGP